MRLFLFEEFYVQIEGAPFSAPNACGGCRASFEELVLDKDGSLRWSRLENLMEESSKSVGYDPSQLWLLAGTPQPVCDAMRYQAHHSLSVTPCFSFFPTCVTKHTTVCL